MAEILNNFEYHHLQNDICVKNNLNQMLETLLFIFFPCNSAFVANVATFFSFNLAFFTKSALPDLLTNPFCFIFKQSFSFVNLF